MTEREVSAIVEAVLYEGYALYPYRASSIKNRQRWTIGGLHPEQSDAVRDGVERASLRAQCLVEAESGASIRGSIGFLHAIDRQPLSRHAGEEYQSVRVLDVDAKRYVRWQEARIRSVTTGSARLEDLCDGACDVRFTFDGGHETEQLFRADGTCAGALMRTWAPISGTIALRAEALGEGLYRITASLRNTSTCVLAAAGEAEPILLSAHVILHATDCEFVSAIDPPEHYAAVATGCSNTGCFPVLVGQPPDRDTMLCSPIILYDYPQVAPESAGDLFDATEIDEILTLRILTMTDAEKREMAGLDERVARVLARSESLSAQALAKLHGAWRVLRPATQGALDVSMDPPEPARGPALAFIRVGDQYLRVNDRVLLRPRRGGDIMDLALAGKVATVESIERDFENAVHVAVTVDDDPGRDLGAARMPAHRFFFRPDELEALPRSPRTGP